MDSRDSSPLKAFFLRLIRFIFNTQDKIASVNINRHKSITTHNESKIQSDLESLMGAVAEIQERTSSMALSLVTLSEQVERVASTQLAAIEKINKLGSELDALAKDLANKLAAAETSVDPDELDRLIERLRASTDKLSDSVEK
jgi:uncharacterized protein YqgV (UPF0045/DUF77 family)